MSVLNCEICFQHNLLEATSANPPFSTICGHIFHRDCLLAWIRLKHTCPKCRALCEERTSHQIFLELGDDESGAVGGVQTGSQLSFDGIEAEIELMAERNHQLMLKNEELMDLLKVFGDQVEDKETTIRSLNTEMEAMALHSVDWHQTLDCAMSGQEAAASQVKKDEAFIETLCTEISRLKKRNFLVEKENQSLQLKAEKLTKTTNRQSQQPNPIIEDPRPFFSVDDMLNFTETVRPKDSRRHEEIIDFEDFFPHQKN